MTDQKKIRMQVALWAYAYEFESDSLVSDAKFDEACRQVDPSIPTDSPEMDAWFKANFNPSTGMWIHSHPHLGRIAEIYRSVRREMTIERLVKRVAWVAKCTCGRTDIRESNPPKSRLCGCGRWTDYKETSVVGPDLNLPVYNGY